MAKREMIKAKQEKAVMYATLIRYCRTHRANIQGPLRRVQKFRTDYTELKASFDSARRQAEVVVSDFSSSKRSFNSVAHIPCLQKNEQHRSELLGPPGTRQRFHAAQAAQASPAESPFRGSTPDPLYASREQHALREHTFIQNAETQFDAFIAQGQEVLNNLVEQRQMLKGTQRRLLDAANTLGLSRNVIGWIEKRRWVSYMYPYGFS
jgi:Golgi SNAP receptor complex protein 2